VRLTAAMLAWTPGGTGQVIPCHGLDAGPLPHSRPARP
jgi:hypothetical protein